MVMTGAAHGSTLTADPTFNTADPLRAERYFQIAPPSRIDLEEARDLVRDERHFILRLGSWHDTPRCCRDTTV